MTTVHMLIPWSGSTLVKNLPYPSVILICFLLLKRMFLALLFMK